MEYKRQTFPATEEAFANLDRVSDLLKEKHGIRKYELVSAVFELLDENDGQVIKRALELASARMGERKKEKEKKAKLLKMIDELSPEQLQELMEKAKQ